MGGGETDSKPDSWRLISHRGSYSCHEASRELVTWCFQEPGSGMVYVTGLIGHSADCLCWGSRGLGECYINCVRGQAARLILLSLMGEFMHHFVLC